MVGVLYVGGAVDAEGGDERGWSIRRGELTPRGKRVIGWTLWEMDSHGQGVDMSSRGFERWKWTMG